MVIRKQRPTPFGEPLWWGTWWMIVSGFPGFSTQAGVINRVWLTPLWFPRPVTISRLSIHITGSGAGSTNLRIGLYADNGGTPDGGALLEESADIAADVVGVKVFTLSTPRELGRGVSAWLALITEDAVVDFTRCTSNDILTEVGSEQIRSCSYSAAAFPALDDPCPTVTNRDEARILGHTRVDKWRG